EFERVVKTARRGVASLAQGATPLEIHREAVQRAREIGQMEVVIGGERLRGTDPDAADILRDAFLARFPVDPDTQDPLGVPEVEARAYGILASDRKLARPAATLEDAKRLYIRERVDGDINEQTKRLRVERIMKHLEAAGIEKS